MQRHGKYCMHKDNRDYNNVEERRDGVVVVGKDSSVSKEAERRCRNAQERKVASKGYSAESIKDRRIESGSGV
jgi:hypothetical protein